MDASLLGLVVLALVDSTSFGTLLIPVWFLLAPGRPRVARLLVFLAVVVAMYLALGVALVAGAGALLDRAAELGDSQPAAVAQALVGAALFAGSFLVTRDRGEHEDGSPGRVLRWRDRAMGADGARGVAPLVGLAVGAVLLEVATMLPYLAATGIIASADLGWAGRLAVLAAYCLVMVLPALVLAGLRVGLRRRVEPWLRRLGAWLQRTGAETTSWILGIVGVLVVLDALPRIELLADLGVGAG